MKLIIPTPPQNRRGQAGEMTDGTGLVNLRARYYDPGTGRFVSRDTWAGMLKKPVSKNLWLYVFDNPIFLTDPTGLIPSQQTANSLEILNDRDLSWWLYKELTNNVNSYYVERIKTMLNSSLDDKLNASLGWVYLVKDSAKWDFKHKISSEMGKAFTFFDNYEGYQWYEYSVPGNIFYGYIGSASGFSSLMLHGGASYAEITDPAHLKRDVFGIDICCPCPKTNGGACEKIICGYFNMAWIGTGFDDHADYNAFQFGIDLYNKYSTGITFRQLINEFTNNGNNLAKPDSIPLLQWTNPVGGWPYTVGRFNGPDDSINEPKVMEYLQ